MSVDYEFYTEAKINGKWQWVDPTYPDKEGKPRKVSSYWGKSALRDTYEKIQEIGKSLNKTDLSEELSNELFRSCEVESYDRPSPYGISVSLIGEWLGKCKNYHQYAGYVERRLIFAWKAEDLDELYDWLSPQEYAKLPEEEKRAYEYFEWDEYDSWVRFFKKFKSIADVRLHDLEDANYSAKVEDIRIVTTAYY